MRKRSGPSLTQQKRALKACPDCNGQGKVKPMFYELPCDSCHASGVVCKETGEALSMEELVIQQRIRLSEYKQELFKARAELMKLRNREDQGYGPNGARYHGD